MQRRLAAFPGFIAGSSYAAMGCSHARTHFCTTHAHTHTCPYGVLSSKATFDSTTVTLKHGAEQTENVKHLNVLKYVAESLKVVSSFLKVNLLGTFYTQSSSRVLLFLSSKHLRSYCVLSNGGQSWQWCGDASR